MAKRELGLRDVGAVALVAVVGSGLFFGLRGFNRGNGGASSARVVTEYRLLASKSSLSTMSNWMPVPVLEYELEGPPASQGLMEAEIVGGDGKRLKLNRTVMPGPVPAEVTLGLPGVKPTPQPDTMTNYKFTLTGYAFAPASPKLVVSKNKKVVYTVPVPALPAPSRTMPLVVPLDDESALVPLAKAETPAQGVFDFYPYRWKLRTTARHAWKGYPNISRTEWPGGSNHSFPLDPEGNGFGFEKREIGGIAEIRFVQPIDKTETREATLDFEIYDDGTHAGLRILAPTLIEFSDGATVKFLAQERKIGRDRQGKLRSLVSLPSVVTHGYSGTIVPGAWGYPRALPAPHRQPPNAPPSGSPLRIVSNHLEFLSPTLEELGISRLEWASEQTDATPKGPIKPGRFQARIRVTHALGVTSVRSRFIRIEP